MNEVTIAIIAGTAAMIFWGIPDVFAKKAIDMKGSYLSIFYSTFFLIIFSLPIFFWENQLPKLDWHLLLIIPLTLLDFVGYNLLFRAYKIGKVSILNPITASYAVCAAIISAILFGEQFTAIKIIAFVTVMVGVVFIAVDFQKFKNDLHTKDFAKGVPLAIMVFLIYGLYVPLWSQYIQGEDWFALIMLSRILFLVLIFFTAFGVMHEKPVRRQDKFFIFIVLNALLLAIGNNIFNWGLNASSHISIITAISSGYPLSLSITAYFVLKERLVLNQYLGIVIIVLGIVLMTLV